MERGFRRLPIEVRVIATIVVLGRGLVWYSGNFWAVIFRKPVSHG